MKINLLTPVWLLLSGYIFAQLSVSNLLEYQLGNLPFEQPTNLTTLYDQLNFSYRYDIFTARFKVEGFQHTDTEKQYTELAQRSIKMDKDALAITLGNSYEIIGRGLLLRSYEIPGTVLEDAGFRTRYGFYRDIDGLTLKYTPDFMELKILRGRPLLNEFPPTIDNDTRRPNLLEAVEANFLLIDNWSFGGTYMRDNDADNFAEYSAASISGNLPLNMQIYGEYAWRLGNGNQAGDFSNKTAHAFYASLNYAASHVGFSFEYKDYNDFNLGYNDPPPLIKEHPYVLLNRSTHVLNPANESGWQGELFLTSSGGHILTINFTEAVNDFGFGKNKFSERFAELSYPLDLSSTIKGYVDFSREPLKFEKDRYAGGIYFEKEWVSLWGSIVDLEYQQFKRDFRDISPDLEIDDVKNYLAAFTISRAPGLSAGILWEHSTDPGITDDPTTPQQETDPRNWLGFNLGYRVNNNHFINLFYGERRGGPACTSGVCYEILDFEGFEFRLTSNF